MRSIKLFVTVAAIFAVGALYFYFNPSYERSLEAKYYYAVGEYKEAHRLAQEAFSLDPYNRMASTIMTQSKTAMRFIDYIDEAKSYLHTIEQIAENDAGVSDSDRAKVKLICEIMMSKYHKIAPTVLTDKALIDEARAYYEKFVKLYNEITRK